MSFFSYISFPRQVDTSCLTSGFDKSKAFTIAEIRGTDLDNGNLNNFPDDAKVYMGDVFTDSQGIQIFENVEASFTDVFKNRFIYSFLATLELLDAEKYIKDCRSYLLDDNIDGSSISEEEFIDFTTKMIEYNKDSVALCRKQLYDIIRINTCPNEIVEIYTEYSSGFNFNFGPVKDKNILNLQQILTSDLLRIEDKLKIEIHNEK